MHGEGRLLKVLKLRQDRHRLLCVVLQELRHHHLQQRLRGPDEPQQSGGGERLPHPHHNRLLRPFALPHHLPDPHRVREFPEELGEVNHHQELFPDLHCTARAANCPAGILLLDCPAGSLLRNSARGWANQRPVRRLGQSAASLGSGQFAPQLPGGQFALPGAGNMVCY